MTVPPMIVRRVVLAPVVLLLDLVLVVVSPILALVALLAMPFARGARPLRVLAIAVEYAARHAMATLACFALWLVSGFGLLARAERTQTAYYDVMGWFVDGVFRAIVRYGRVDVHVNDSEEAHDALAAGRRPVVVLSRHAGEGDSLLVLHELLCRYRRRPRVVLHEALQFDPLIDVLCRRLPNRFVDPRGGDTEVLIAEMTRGIDDAGAVLIFPEGGNFSPARKERSIRRLLERGHHAQAEMASQMEHVAPPRPGGALAAIEAAPEHDVVIMGHVGFPTSLAEAWRLLPAPQTIEVKLWHEPWDTIPPEGDARIDWLFERWRRLDAWVEERRAARGEA